MWKHLIRRVAKLESVSEVTLPTRMIGGPGYRLSADHTRGAWHWLLADLGRRLGGT